MINPVGKVVTKRPKRKLQTSTLWRARAWLSSALTHHRQRVVQVGRRSLLAATVSEREPMTCARGRTPEHEIILPEDVRTLPELFLKAQYETCNSDKDDFNFTYRKNDLYSIYNKTDSAIKHANYKGG